MIKTTETKLKGFVVSMADTIQRCHRKVINPSQKTKQFLLNISIKGQNIAITTLYDGDG